MAYTLKKADSPVAIKEREYAVGNLIKFSKFTSCIGIIALVQPQGMIGIHLVLQDDGDAPISEAVVHAVKSELETWKYLRTSMIILGQISVWKKSAPKILDDLRALGLHVEEYPLGDGVYGARLTTTGKIELTY